MDNKVLIGFFVFLAAFLILPIVVQQIRLSQQPEGGVPAQGGVPQAASTDPLANNSEINQPPLLNEANLIGTEWQVQVEQFKIKVTLDAGGVCYATHPLAKNITGMDYLEGRWYVNYDKFYVTTFFGGREYNAELKISGSNLYYLEKDSFKKMERYR